MDTFHTDLSSAGLIAAVEANMAHFFGIAFQDWSGANTHYSDTITWSITDVDLSIFNSTMRVRLSADDAEAEIEAAIARAQVKNVPLQWWLSPDTQPGDLGDRLTAHGFEKSGNTPGMAIDLSILDDEFNMPPGVTVEQVTDQAMLDVYIDVMNKGFGLPAKIGAAFNECFAAIGLGTDQPLRHFLARLDDEPVATSSVFFGAGVAGIYNVATVEAARGKGIGSAVTTYPLLLARKMGVRVGILKSSEMGFNVYRKMGFKQVCTFNIYVWRSENGNE